MHDVIDGYRIESGDQDAAWADARVLTGMDLRSESADDLECLARVVRALASGGERRMGLVLDYASQLVGSVNDLTAREHTFFSTCLKLSHEAVHHHPADGSCRTLYNPVFWVVEREHDLPAWLTAGNRGIRAIPVPWPTLAERQQTAEMLTGVDRGDTNQQHHTDKQHDTNQQHSQHAAEQIATRTDRMPTASLFDISTLFVDQQIDHEDAEDAIRIYTLGAADEPLGGATALVRPTERSDDIEETLGAKNPRPGARL